MPPRDPGVSLIRPTNLSDSQIIGNLLDSVGKEILTLIIHSVRGCISSRSVPPGGRPRRCVRQVRKMQCRDGNEPLSLNHLILLFVSPLFCSPLHLFFPIRARLATAVLCRFSSLSHILSLPTRTLSELENKKNSG